MSAKSLFSQIVEKYKRGLLLIVFLIASSLLILFNGTPGVAKPQEIGLSIFSFFQGLISQSGHWFSQTTDSMVEMANLKENYQTAKEQLKKYEGMERSYIDILDENKKLKDQLNFVQSYENSTISSEIVSKDPTRVYSTVVINKGYLDGVRKNFPVLAYQNGTYGLVGKILEVGLTASIVQPILDANLFVAARFHNTRYQGLVSGKGSNEESLVMTYVSKKAREELKIGDLVETDGMDSLYPKGMVIGRVKSITLKDYESSLDVELEPIISFSKLEYLTIVRTE